MSRVSFPFLSFYSFICLTSGAALSFQLIKPLKTSIRKQSNHFIPSVFQYSSRALQSGTGSRGIVRQSLLPPFKNEMGSVEEPEAGNVASITDLGFNIAYPFALRAAVLLNVPKIIQAAGPGAALSAAEICKSFANPERASSENLEKILEILSCYGMLSRTKEETGTARVKKYGLTSLSKDLTREVSTDYLLFVTAPELIKIWLNIHEAVLNADEVVFEKLYGNKLFPYLKEDVPELGRFHVRMMEKMSELQLEYLLEHYDKEFRSLKGTLVDVGGSQGRVAAAIASKYPNIQCVVNFDLPAVVSGAPEYRGVKHAGGSFLDFVPKGDMLFMKFVLLLWNDEDTVKLLRNCYDALPAKGKLIMVERVQLESEPEDTTSRKRTAIHSLLTSLGTKGGKARTLKQLRSAAEAAGFARLQVVKQVDSFTNFIEAEKA